MKKITLLIVVGFLFITSCKEEKRNEEPSKMEQVMAIHNEVMPKMGQLGKLVGQLKPMADSLGVDSPQAKAMRDLQDANKAMMDWMQSFGNRFDHSEVMEGKELSEEKKLWLNEEEIKMKELKEKINSSIANAEALPEKTN
ncbi:hypothetical protein NYZ99_18220 [Maribacter litopenaei]|uniref:Viral A-type inclusion protein n=1 Tax=Maribacter litopenaei TaxID=2976127 RepID=A0ABY5Y910_9FLAO|nr:hypothetical protein [Maribacter litopenaei]UWX54734.1 hypothetical protein NYZ99_18220 [Maribacter litopenaei]